MFKLAEYVNSLTVRQDDEELAKSKDLVELIALICDDPWLTRQAYYGMAGAMERQLEYLGGTLLPNTDSRIMRMASEGIMHESLTVDSWFGTTNENGQHINDEVSKEQQIDDAKTFRDQLAVRMRTAAIVFVAHVRAHDEISKDLNQLSYGQIKAKAEANRKTSNANKKVAF